MKTSTIIATIAIATAAIAYRASDDQPHGTYRFDIYTNETRIIIDGEHIATATDGNADCDELLSTETGHDCLQLHSPEYPSYDHIIENLPRR